MGLTGLEPVTLRLSSACSNQLSYRPGERLRRQIFESRWDDFRLFRQSASARPLCKSAIANRKSKIRGGKGIRTPDIQLAKLALYQLSYAPESECRV